MSVIQKWWNRLVTASGKHGYACDSCGDELFAYPLHRLCKSCESGLEKNDKIVCPKCGRKVVSTGVCTTCKSILPTFTCALSPFVYRAETASLVNRIKNGDRRIAFYFAERMTDKLLCRFPLTELDILTLPVPMTEEKRIKRGYNQAETLAKRIAECLAEKGINANLHTDVLQRKREIEQQKHLTLRERKQNSDGAFHLHKRKICQGKTVLLIDDILTTGATGSACAKLLLHAGAKSVILLTIASLPERK